MTTFFLLPRQGVRSPTQSSPVPAQRQQPRFLVSTGEGYRRGGEGKGTRVSTGSEMGFTWSLTNEHVV